MKLFLSLTYTLQICNSIYPISNVDGQFHSIHLAEYLPAKTKCEPDPYSQKIYKVEHSYGIISLSTYLVNQQNHKISI